MSKPNRLVEHALNTVKWALRDAADRQLNGQLAITYAGHLDLISVDPNFYGDAIWFTTSHRADVEALMTIAPAGTFWRKSVEGSYIHYTINIPDYPSKTFVIRTTGAGLPPTCELVEVEVDIPAQPAKPATKRTQTIVRCNEPDTPPTAVVVEPQI